MNIKFIFSSLAGIVLLGLSFVPTTHAMIVGGGSWSLQTTVESYLKSSNTQSQKNFINTFLAGRLIASFYRSGAGGRNDIYCRATAYYSEGYACRRTIIEVVSGSYTVSIPVITGYTLTLYRHFWSYGGANRYESSKIYSGIYQFTAQNYKQYNGLDFTAVYTKN